MSTRRVPELEDAGPPAGLAPRRYRVQRLVDCRPARIELEKKEWRIVPLRIHRCRGPICLECGRFVVREMTDEERARR